VDNIQNTLRALNELMNQPTQFGLTVGQLTLIIGGPIALVVGIVVLRIALGISGFLLRFGCVLLLLFICAGITAFAFFQFAVR
jgi:hypothetical protein